MIELASSANALLVQSGDGDLRPRHDSQLAFWGFTRQSDGMLAAQVDNPAALASKLVAYFEREGVQFLMDQGISSLLERQSQARKAIQDASDRCRRLKAGILDDAVCNDFRRFAKTGLTRQLKDHQLKSALHLLLAGNGANFSVPGSGKTSVVLSVFAFLREQGLIRSLFVVGPPACFDPWRIEYQLVLGSEPSCQTLAGGNIDDRRSRYLVDGDNVADLYLTTFQTLQRDWPHVRRLFEQRGVQFFMVIDEAHYIKQPDGAWAEAVLSVARHATRRCILTGTPFPKSYTDAFNLFDALWPDVSPISQDQRHQIERFAQRKELSRAGDVLTASIGPLFYRVRKPDLHLAPQIFHDPIKLRMNRHERQVYDSIIERIEYASQSDFFRDFDLLVRLRRGRMVRLRQCISYTALLSTAVREYSEDLVDDPSVADIIRHYDDIEKPAKLEALIALVSQLRSQGEKIVIWSNFVRTLQTIAAVLSHQRHGVQLIFGGTPFERSNVDEEMTREHIIRQFKDPKSGIDILVANPAACAESISLHTACCHAIYYDLSYNCAQYLQSLDRIHRVGGSEDKSAHYHTLLYSDTIDEDVLTNVRTKAANMSAVIDQDYPVYSLDMFNDDDELEAYDRLFGKSN